MTQSFDEVRLGIVAHALTGTDEEVGPACSRVVVPQTIAQDDDFRDAYAQGYRHALSDARWWLKNHKNQEVGRLRAALTNLIEDLEARWDMADPRTNPGIVVCVEQGKSALHSVKTAAPAPAEASNDGRPRP